MFISITVEMTREQLHEVKEQFRSNQVVCERVVGLFHLLSNKPRFRIACMLMHGEACVQELAEVVADGKMTNISQQLKMLRLGGVVTKRRDKKQILYSISDEKIARLITFLRTEFLEDQTL
ncbi:MAG: helix-turn-helix transcriptional regulator [Verrucomicrobiae bacterium]|nr:helix-turn-helix transcriptional regulator [Verrucomicrobiae bacterium]